jgi:alkylation response protein AidB-like acyl-CoA dehydrogenase
VVAQYADDVDKQARFTESFEALRKAKLLSAYVPKANGGYEISTEVNFANYASAGNLRRVDRNDIRDASNSGRMYRATRKR